MPRFHMQLKMPSHNALDYTAYSAVGAGIAIEASGLGDLPWWYYVIMIGLPVVWSIIGKMLESDRG